MADNVQFANSLPRFSDPKDKTRLGYRGATAYGGQASEQYGRAGGWPDYEKVTLTLTTGAEAKGQLQLDRLETMVANLAAQLRRYEERQAQMIRRQVQEAIAPVIAEWRQDAVRKEFITLAEWWHEATDAISSPSRITSHNAYLKIIALGGLAVPLILRDLLERGGDWYLALRILTDANPVPPQHEGYAELMDEDWLNWGREQGYIG